MRRRIGATAATTIALALAKRRVDRPAGVSTFKGH